MAAFAVRIADGRGGESFLTTGGNLMSETKQRRVVFANDTDKLAMLIGYAIHRWSMAMHLLVICTHMLRHQKMPSTPSDLGCFWNEEKDELPFILVPDKKKIIAFEKMCGEYPDIISKEELDKLICSLHEGIPLRNFFAHDVLVDKGGKVVFHFKADKKDTLKAAFVSIKKTCLQEQVFRIEEIGKAMASFHNRITRAQKR